MANKHYNHVNGVKKETLACNYLTEVKNFKIIERNYSCKIGEIDIIAMDGTTIVFVEVKYRTTATFGYGREAIDYHKIMKIRNTATYYLKSVKKLDSAVRFDVIDILGDKVDYIANAI